MPFSETQCWALLTLSSLTLPTLSNDLPHTHKAILSRSPWLTWHHYGVTYTDHADVREKWLSHHILGQPADVSREVLTGWSSAVGQRAARVSSLQQPRCHLSPSSGACSTEWTQHSLRNHRQSGLSNVPSLLEIYTVVSCGLPYCPLHPPHSLSSYS